MHFLKCTAYEECLFNTRMSGAWESAEGDKGEIQSLSYPVVDTSTFQLHLFPAFMAMIFASIPPREPASWIYHLPEPILTS